MSFLKNPRFLAAVAVVVVILAVALWPSSLEVDVAPVTRGAMQVTIDEDGETRVRERFVVSAPVAGRLERIQLEPGDPVTRGMTVVARLTPAAPTLIDPRTRGELTAAVDAARAAVGQARAERDRSAAEQARARSTLKRQQELADAGAVARDTLEGAQTALATADEAVRAAEFAVTRANYELQLSRARLQEPTAPGRTVDVVSPVDGVVLKRLRESETVVPAGEPLLEIGDPQRLEVVADLLSTDAVRVKPGDSVLIDRWGGDRPLQARLRRIEPAGFMKVSALGVEEQRVNVVVDIVDPAAAGRLGDGYRVEVRVVVARAEDAVKAPVGTLFRRGEGWAAFVVDDGVARLQTVQLGLRNSTDAEIASGLRPGQTLVLHPPDTLREGMRVTPRPQES